MYRTQLVFVSRGSLPDLTPEEAVDQKSRPHNPRLLALFKLLGEINARGSSLPMIWELYRSEELEPQLSTNEHAVALILPNVSTTRNPYLSHLRNDSPSLRGDASDYARLSNMGALPPDIQAAYDRERRLDEEALQMKIKHAGG